MNTVFQAVIEHLKNAYTMSFGLWVSIIGLWTMISDSKQMTRQGLQREAIVYRTLGGIYAVAGVGIAVIIQLIS